MSTSTAMNEEEPPLKRRRMTMLMLPDDVVFNCVARVSRLYYYYPTLSLVSKRFRSLLSSVELHQTRTLLGRAESCLYVFLRHSCHSQRWFTLSQRPNSSKKVLVPISSPNFPSARWSKFAAVGPNIYAIGGPEHMNSSSEVSSNVMVMDCRSHTWYKAPSMHVARGSHSVCVLDGKIYVTGGGQKLDSTNWMEVFDTKTQTWEFMQIPGEELCKSSELQSLWYEGNFYVRSRSQDKFATYKLHKGRWREADFGMNHGWGGNPSSYCVIENVFYRHYTRRTIEWFDSKRRLWTSLKGLVSLSRNPYDTCFHLVDYGGKIAVLWEEFVKYPEGKRIWCAVIAFDKRQTGEIWGMIEWFDVVFTTDEQSSLGHALATTV